MRNRQQSPKAERYRVPVTLTQPNQQPARRSYTKYANYLVRSLAQYPKAITSIDAIFRQDPTVGVNSPWWNRHAIRYLEGELRPGQRVFEWGSGGSTAWFASKGAQVTSVEHNQEWVGKVKSRGLHADIRAIPGAVTGKIAEPYLTHNLTDERRRFFDDYIATIDEFPEDSLDVVLVDGMCRAECFRRARPKVRPGGLLIIDDSDMPPYRSLGKLVPGWEKTAFAGFKVSKDLRQTTFFRRPR
jgi:hypothetical protein